MSFFAIKTKKDYDFSVFTIVNSMEFHYPKGFSDKKCLCSKLWYPKVGGAKQNTGLFNIKGPKNAILPHKKELKYYYYFLNGSRFSVKKVLVSKIFKNLNNRCLKWKSKILLLV